MPGHKGFYLKKALRKFAAYRGGFLWVSNLRELREDPGKAL